MAKYDPLFRHLVAADASAPIEMTFDDIERLVGPLPASASKYSACGTTSSSTRLTCKPVPGSTPDAGSSSSIE